MVNCGSIRFAPPLVISEEDVRKAIRIIGESLQEWDTVSSQDSNASTAVLEVMSSGRTHPRRRSRGPRHQD